MSTLVFDDGLFDSAIFGGDSVLFDDGLFDSAFFDVGTPLGLTQRRALYLDGFTIREITDALIGTGIKPLVLLNGQMRERATSEGVAVIAIEGRLRCIDTTTEELVV